MNNTISDHLKGNGTNEINATMLTPLHNGDNNNNNNNMNNTTAAVALFPKSNATNNNAHVVPIEEAAMLEKEIVDKDRQVRVE